MIKEFFEFLENYRLNVKYIHKQLRKLKENNLLITGYTVDYNHHKDAYDITINFSYKSKNWRELHSKSSFNYLIIEQYSGKGIIESLGEKD